MGKTDIRFDLLPLGVSLPAGASDARRRANGREDPQLYSDTPAGSAGIGTGTEESLRRSLSLDPVLEGERNAWEILESENLWPNEVRLSWRGLEPEDPSELMAGGIGANVGGIIVVGVVTDPLFLGFWPAELTEARKAPLEDRREDCGAESPVVQLGPLEGWGKREAWAWEGDGG